MTLTTAGKLCLLFDLVAQIVRHRQDNLCYFHNILSRLLLRTYPSFISTFPNVLNTQVKQYLVDSVFTHRKVIGAGEAKLCLVLAASNELFVIAGGRIQSVIARVAVFGKVSREST